MRFVVPPGWPARPEGWVPDQGWRPPPEWPAPPPGWRFWVGDTGRPVAGPIGAYGARVSWRRFAGFSAAALAGAVAVGSSASAASRSPESEAARGLPRVTSVPSETTAKASAPATTAPATTVTATVVTTVVTTVTVTAAPVPLAGGGGSPQDSTPESATYYPNCAAARAAGAAPMHRGEPGYRPGLDGDHDGVACE